MKKYKIDVKNRSDFASDPELKKIILQIQANCSKWSFKKYNQKLQSLIKIYPKETYLAIWAAAIYGDYGECLGLKAELIYKKKTCQILKDILNQKKLDPRLRFYARNEYYYHSGNYEKQYLLGPERLKEGYNGHFSAGVGASMYALELKNKNEITKSKKFARIALKHWKTFDNQDLLRNNRYFICIAYAVLNKTTDCKKLLKVIKQEDPFSKTIHKKYFDRIEKLCDVSLTF